MLYIHTIVNIVDNSGGFVGLCVQVIGQNKRARVGDALAISVKTILINRKITHRRKRKVLKGTVRRAIVLRVAYYKRRKNNIFFKGTTNAVAILGNWGLPLATRAKGPGHYELKLSKYPKFANICEGVI
jgi:ribosomal protein L14